jgi:hypothetical protein
MNTLYLIGAVIDAVMPFGILLVLLTYLLHRSIKGRV